MHGLKFRGRPPIKYADSVKEVVYLSNPYALAIMDRSFEITDEFVASILAQSVFSWEGRNPRPALDEDGNFQCTDLDLFSFLMPIVNRGAVIELPKYQNRRQIVRKSNERRIGNSQFGITTGLVSNKEVFSFSVKLWDQTVAVEGPDGSESLGAHRNYMLVDCDGHWYDGWNSIIWKPSAEENRFLTESELWTGNSVVFQHYVHPNRWQSVFGAPYLLMKMLIARLYDEASYYGDEMHKLQSSGYTLPQGERRKYFKPKSKGTTAPIKVKTMEFILDFPDFKGSYCEGNNTGASLVYAYRRRKHLLYKLKPMVQFVVRADEAAYFKHGGVQMKSIPKVAHWMGNRTWNLWRARGGRIIWNQMYLSNDVALRYRVREKTERISAE